jgi:hypothetical protein
LLLAIVASGCGGSSSHGGDSGVADAGGGDVGLEDVVHGQGRWVAIGTQ